jgi:hypothetical protein
MFVDNRCAEFDVAQQLGHVRLFASVFVGVQTFDEAFESIRFTRMRAAKDYVD